MLILIYLMFEAVSQNMNVPNLTNAPTQYNGYHDVEYSGNGSSVKS